MMSSASFHSDIHMQGQTPAGLGQREGQLLPLPGPSPAHPYLAAFGPHTTTQPWVRKGSFLLVLGLGQALPRTHNGSW